MANDKSMGSLSKRLKARREQLNQRVEGATKAGALAGLRAATQSTPVDTGNARVNWNVSVKVPVVSVSSLPKGTRVSEGQASQDAEKRGRARIARFKLPDQTIWITNGVRYIKKLDTGGLSKKGGQMSAKAILAATRAIKIHLSRGIFRRGS